MEMYRIYFIARPSSGGDTRYLCEQPGIWTHWCNNPDYCVPFTQNQAIKAAQWYTSHAGDVDGACKIEKYTENRKLKVNDKGDYRPASYAHLLLSYVWRNAGEVKA